MALIASSIADLWFWRREKASVWSFVERKMWWLVKNSIIAIRGFLIAVWSALDIVSKLVSTGKKVQSLELPVRHRAP